MRQQSHSRAEMLHVAVGTAAVPAGPASRAALAAARRLASSASSWAASAIVGALPPRPTRDPPIACRMRPVGVLRPLQQMLHPGVQQRGQLGRRQRRGIGSPTITTIGTLGRYIFLGWPLVQIRWAPRI